MTITQDRVMLRFADSAETFAAPHGMTEMDAVAWLARAGRVGTERHIKSIGSGVYLCSNGRRGIANRTCVIHVVK